MRRIALIISVVGSVKRGGESTTSGLVSFLDRHTDIHVYSGGTFSYEKATNIGFPEAPFYSSFYHRMPLRVQRRLLRRLHLDPLSIRNFFFCRRVLKHLRDDLPDVAVFRSVGPWGAKAGRVLRARHGVPFVTIEGGWKKGERETARYNPNLHIAVNVEVTDYLLEQLPEVSIECIPNGISLKDFDPDGEPAHVDLPRPLVLGCGFLGEVKRFHLTVDAVHLIEGASLLILGQGELEEELRRLGGQKLGERFRIAAVPHDEMAGFYRAADVVTVPSGYESFGMVYLEAMACNRPVVATRDRNREAVIGDGGELVDPTDIRAYAAALRRCIKTDYGDRPRRRAEEFDWEKIGPRYLEAFETVVSSWKESTKSQPVFRRLGD
jgi:glycosyltransferase involved in cell wall biosynthesis